MIILGINTYYPDASTALLKDGTPLWAGEEERYNRIKQASGFPKIALRKCLEETRVPPEEIDAIAMQARS